MMSGPENNRRGIDGVIHDRRSRIADCDRQLSEFRVSGITDAPERTAVLKTRSELSASQGYDKASARRQEKARRQSTPMTRGVAIRIA